MKKITKIFTALLFLAVGFSSCKKDYVCTCEIQTTTKAIYYLNKIETDQYSSSTYSNKSINGTKKNANKACDDLNTEVTQTNNSLPEGRTGGDIVTQTKCQIQ